MLKFKPLLCDFIQYYYRSNVTGGLLHIALDDGNLDDRALGLLQQDCWNAGDTFGYFLVTLMRHFTTEELELMYDRGWWGMRERLTAVERARQALESGDPLEMEMALRQFISSTNEVLCELSDFTNFCDFSTVQAIFEVERLVEGTLGE